MRLIERLAELAAGEESLFRAQLLREDVARLEAARALARSTPDLAAFQRAGARLGWTQGDARTMELAQPLQALLELVYRHEREGATDTLENELEAAWRALHRTRMERLVGCLATPTPKPTE